MKNLLSFFIVLIALNSCFSSRKTTGYTYGDPEVKQQLIDESTFKISVYSQDKTYGYTEKQPVMVGGVSEGPKNERRFLNALAGPKGEKVQYYRLGSCCPFKTKNSELGGMLDKYEVSYEGLDTSFVLYINMYDSDTLKVPVGLKLKL
jgi:hypothetical protein